jgi:hypothetical protein
MAEDGLVTGNITVEARQAIRNLLSVLNEAGYGPEHVVRCGVWLEDPRDSVHSMRSFASSSATSARTLVCCVEHGNRLQSGDRVGRVQESRRVICGIFIRARQDRNLLRVDLDHEIGNLLAPLENKLMRHFERDVHDISGD